MILDDLELISSEYKVQNDHKMKYNQFQESKGLAAITHLGILAIIWVTKLGLRWFLNHFKAKIKIYISNKTSKSNAYDFMVKELRYRTSFLLPKSEIEFWLVEVILVIYQPKKFQIVWFLMCIGGLEQTSIG